MSSIPAPAIGLGTDPGNSKRSPTPIPPLEKSAWQKYPLAPFALIALFLGIMALPPARTNPRLIWTFIGVASALLTWTLIVWAVVKRRAVAFPIEFTPIKSHYVQASVQFSIMLYWGWFWPTVYGELPLIFAQIVFVYTLDALFSWSRGRTWRLGFGPMPIVISTNLLLWFKHDWFYYQFVMLTLGVLGKQFVTWTRDGKKTHIFNPSAFGQSIIAYVLIFSGTTYFYTWGREIAVTFEAPHMLVVIFLGGLVVQYFFSVTLMTFAAVATLCVFNLIYTQITGLYFLVNINIAAPIFLGLHLLMTDPATSPKTYMGRVIFGVLYALGYLALFRLFDDLEIPVFWDKLLPVPFLNLCVPLIDRMVRLGFLGRVTDAWQNALPPRKMNLVHMGCWAALFVAMYFTGFIEASHPGNSIPFWKKAYTEGKHHADHGLVMAVGAQAEGGKSPAAYNELGLICMEGKIVNQKRGTAAKHFARACEMGNINGCANVAIQFLFLHERRSNTDVLMALENLEQACGTNPDWGICFLVGVAYETGRGRPTNLLKAMELYERCGRGNIYGAKGLARVALQGMPYDLREIAPVLDAAATQGDAEACWYLGYIYQSGYGGVQRDEQRAKAMMEKACTLGMDKACEVSKLPAFPKFSKPTMLVPGWSTAFPI